MIELVSIDDEEAQIRVDGRLHVVPYVIQGAKVNFAFDGEIYWAEMLDTFNGGRVFTLDAQTIDASAAEAPSTVVAA